ncbi:MAG TPA: bifunctional riboflavin kinase/FAD synthetase, partial [Candidatus Binatia bacterium]|nr:bifunctional riboflavin kinase/FAD synthetase [Candidatus Binatia bacterium]
MKIFRDIEDPGLSVSGTVATMGNFDGVHLGHQMLVRNTVSESKRMGCPSIIVTFEPHPLKVLAPERAPLLILSYEDKMALLQSLGVDIVIAQRFDRRFASIAADEFVWRFLVDRLKVKKLWVGRDLRFGQGRKGGTDSLLRLAPRAGFEVSVLDPILLGGVRISSSRIRQLLEEGHVDKVRPMLGRYHFVSGCVVPGHRRGQELGFPTANIATETELIPHNGIYATLIQFKNQQWLSVSSIGVNPTFGDGPRTVESFILDFQGDVYGERARLSFVQRIRDEKKFGLIQDLVAQMHEDVKQAKALFKEFGLSNNT